MFVWRFRGERISAIANKYEIVSNNSVSTLTVVGVGGSDEGDYNCSVSNRFGPDSTSAFITILGIVLSYIHTYICTYIHIYITQCLFIYIYIGNKCEREYTVHAWFLYLLVCNCTILG